MNKGYIYIITNINHTVLYTGVTSDLTRRIRQHRMHQFGGFSARYSLTELVYFEEHPNMESAIVREKQIKQHGRQYKIGLINDYNPCWLNLLIEDE